jgi:hypothetical protein
MERKEVNAVLVKDFEDFLREKGLYDRYESGQLLCEKCGKPITSENIAFIFYKEDYRFCCDNPECMKS